MLLYIPWRIVLRIIKMDCTELAERRIDDGKYLMMGFMANWNFWTFAPVPWCKEWFCGFHYEPGEFSTLLYSF